jgi:hypothetical protein
LTQQIGLFSKTCAKQIYNFIFELFLKKIA